MGPRRSGARGQGCPSWPTLLRQASGRRTGAAWILFFTALGRSAVLQPHARCSAPSRRPTAATRGRGGRRSHCGSAAPQGGYPELCRPGPQRLVALAREAGGRWGPEVCGLVDRLVASGHSARLQPSAARPRPVGAAGGGHCSAPPCSAPSLPLCSEGVGFPSRGRLRRASPTSPMSLLWLARPGPAFCLRAARRRRARASYAFLGGRFGGGGVEGFLGLVAAGRKKAREKGKTNFYNVLTCSFANWLADGKVQGSSFTTDYQPILAEFFAEHCSNVQDRAHWTSESLRHTTRAVTSWVVIPADHFPSRAHVICPTLFSILLHKTFCTGEVFALCRESAADYCSIKTPLCMGTSTSCTLTHRSHSAKTDQRLAESETNHLLFPHMGCTPSPRSSAPSSLSSPRSPFRMFQVSFQFRSWFRFCHINSHRTFSPSSPGSASSL